MRVRELIALLADADPEAVVLVFPQYADDTDGGELGDVLIPTAPWIHETGVCLRRRYEVFYPGAAAERDELYANIDV